MAKVKNRKPVMRVLLVIALAALAAAMLAWRPSIETIEPPPRASFNPGMVERGTRLAAVGNCAGCHTAAGGSPYSGGLAMATPFGTIYSTNITPEPRTGIGAWSEAAFRRAMREGIGRDGRHLYPAFPYDHFTRIADDDIGALYAFVMTRDPVSAPARDNDLIFPLGFRPLVAGWKLLFLDKGPFRPDNAQSVEWNRGAYLADALGHCSACHSARNMLGAENRRQYLGGGEAEGWYAPALNAQSPSPQPWTVEQLAEYLRTGIARDHAMAGGPMQGVVDSLRHADRQDVQAIAVYIKSMLGEPSQEQQARAAASMQRASLKPPAPAANTEEGRMLQLGASVYGDACARCHDQGRAISSGGALQMPLAIAVHDPDPRSLIRIVLDGIVPAPGQRGRWMPGFAEALTDEQLVALLAYLRRYAADAPAWPELAATVKKARSP